MLLLRSARPTGGRPAHTAGRHPRRRAPGPVASAEADAPLPPHSAADDATAFEEQDAAAARAALDDLMSLARSPIDLLSFGPRAALGALLSLPDLTDRLTMTVERATELLQDPRPPGDKAPDALGLVAGDLAALVRKGAAAEAGVVSSIASALPPDIRDALPPEFLSGGNARTDGRGGASSAAGGGGGEAPGGGASPPGAASSASDARASAEAAGLETAARRVRDAASALVAAGAGAPGAALLRLNLAEARAGLAGALGALGPGADGLGEDAVGGVGALMEEVDAVLGMRTGGVRKE